MDTRQIMGGKRLECVGWVSLRPDDTTAAAAVFRTTHADAPFCRIIRPQSQSALGNSPQTAFFPASSSSLTSFTRRERRSQGPSCPRSSRRSTRLTRLALSLSVSKHILVVVGAQDLR
jgi:hypothetical protein